MQDILDLMEQYLYINNIWIGDVGIDEVRFDDATYEWMKKEWSILEEMANIRKQITDIIGTDDVLFRKYLCLCSSLKIEDYENAEIFKNEILSYGKIS